MKRTKGSRSEVGMLYQYGVTALLAAKLSGNNNVADYIIYSSENSAGKFDDIVARVKLKEQDDWYLYLIQVKYKQTKRLNVSDNLRGNRIEYFLSDYIQCFNDILNNPNLTCRYGIPDDNIRFNIFCDKGIQTPVFLRQDCTFQLNVCRHLEVSDGMNNVLFPFGDKYWKFVCKDLEKSQFQYFFDKCCLYLEQPNHNNLNKLIEDACQIRNTKEIINYVKDYFNDDYLYKQGLRKEVFEIELQKIRLVDDIIPLTSFADIIDDNRVAIWNEITIKHDITAVNCIQNYTTEPCLYSCLIRKLNNLLDVNLDWNECVSKKNNLGDELMNKFLTYSETKKLRYWIDPPTSLRLLFIEMWKCGDLPLILRTHIPLSNFERYAHLKRSYIILDDWTKRSEEINNCKMDIFASLGSIANSELQDRMLKDTLVSPQGRKPVTLKNLLRDDKEMMSVFTCADILKMMRKRMPFLKERYFRGINYLVFIIEDDECAEISDRIEPYAIGHNVRITCPPGQIDECLKMIRGHAYISQHYTIYYLRRIGEKLVVTHGDPQRLNNRFVDQYGDPLFISNAGEYIPIIGQTIELNELQYIPRQLRKVTLPRSFFKAQQTQICVLSGDLDLIKPNIEFSSIDDVINGTISIKKKTYFVQIHKKEKRQYYWRKLSHLKYPILDVYSRDGKLELLRYKNCKSLNSYISYDGGIESAQEFFNEIRDESDEIAVVTGDAGIGKSSFLKWLFNNYSTQDYIIFYDLINLQVDLNKSKQQRMDLIDFIFGETQKGLPQQYTYFVSTIRRKKRLIWVLDSFDEIRLACEQQVLDLIRVIANSGAQVIIATRIENCKILMDQFDVRLIKIEPLEEKDCFSYWELDKELLKNVSSELAMNPLYLNFLKMISINKTEVGNITKYTLFEQVINMKIKFCLRETYKILHDADIQRTVLIFEKLALVAMFGRKLVEEELYWLCDKEVFDMTKFGIVIRFDENNYPIFYHRSFIDFLVAQWIAKACRINLYKNAARHLYKQICSENKLHILNILFEEEEIHSAVLQTNINGLKEIINKNSGWWNIVDRLGRTALHAAVISCSDSNRLLSALHVLDSVITSMLEINSDMDKPDIIMNWNWSEYMQPEIFDFVCGFEKEEVVRIYLRLQRKKMEEYNCSSMIFPTTNFYSIFVWALRFRTIDVISDLVLLQNFNRKVFYNFYQACLGLVPKAGFLWTKDFQFEGLLTPIHIACINGSVAMIQYLIKVGVDVDAVDFFGCVPLQYSIMRCCLSSGKSNSIYAVKLLLEAGANPNLNPFRNNGISILCLAVQTMDMTVVRMLLERGATVCCSCNGGETALHFAVRLGNMDIVRCLLRYDAQLSIKNQENETPVDIALKHNNKEMVDLLNDHVAYIQKEEVVRAKNVLQKYYRANTTYLHEAVNYGDVDIINDVLETVRGDINIQNISGCTLLHTALHKNDIGAIKFLLGKGADVGIRDRCGDTPLHVATQNNDTNVIEMILETGCNTNVVNNFGKLPIYYAAENNNIDAVNLLLKKGANVNIDSPGCVTPLHVAVRNTNEDIVRLLLENGADPEIHNEISEICLHISVRNRHRKITEMLLRYGANPNVRCQKGSTPLILSALLEDMEMLRLLIEYGANLNDEYATGDTLLFYAVESGNEDMVKFLLEKGANCQNKNGDSVLFCAAKLELTHIVTLLLKMNVNIDRKGGTAALGLYASKGDINNVKLLLSKGVSVNYCYNEIEATPLHHAIEGHIDIVALLLENGAQINVNCGKYFTPLSHAVRKKQTNIVKLLVDKGANVNTKCMNDCCTALILAIRSEDISIIEVLMEANIDINHGVEALRHAIHRGNINIIELLLQKGAKTSNENKESPLYTAVCKGRTDMVRLLLEYGADVNNNLENRYIPLLKAAQDRNNEIARLLIDNGANIDAIIGNWTALRFKTCQNDADFVKFLLEKGADVNIKFKDGFDALQIAIDCGYTNIVDVLLEGRADERPQTSNGNNFLRLAARRGDLYSVLVLLESGADVITDNVNGTALIHDCAREGNVNVMEMLFEKKVDLNIQDKMGNTALHIAVIEENASVVKLLLENNAHSDIANINGKTAFEIVVEKLCTDVGGSNSSDNMMIMSLILENMKTIGVNDKAVITSFYWAAERGHLKTIELLLRHGVNVNVQNPNGYTPLHVAVNNNNESIVDILLENGADICLKTNDGFTPLCVAKLNGYENLTDKCLSRNCS